MKNDMENIDMLQWEVQYWKDQYQIEWNDYRKKKRRKQQRNVLLKKTLFHFWFEKNWKTTRIHYGFDWNSPKRMSRVVLEF